MYGQIAIKCKVCPFIPDEIKAKTIELGPELNTTSILK